eukprot:212654_1
MDTDTTETQELFKSQINKMYTSFNDFLTQITTPEYPESDHDIENQISTSDSNHPQMIGPMPTEQWQEIMAEANKRIRSLQFTQLEQKQHLNRYVQQIDDLVESQRHLRLSHKTELSLIQNDQDHQRVQRRSLMQQVQKLQKLRDEMTAKFSLTERKAHLLLQEKVELESELEAIRRSTASHDIPNDLHHDVSYWKQKALAFEAAVNDLKVKYTREFKRRRRLYNELQDLKGNIRVFARCRPLLPHEIQNNCSEITSFPDSESISVITQKNQTERFRFDRVFSPQSNNDEVYKETAPYIESVMDGYNVTIFAYGQTGSGKTFTMSAVNNHALHELFQLQEEKQSEWTFGTTVSMLEIYNENIIDLLDKKGNKPLKIRMKGKQETYVDGLKNVTVNGLQHVKQLMECGASNRSVAHTKMNAESSRSHSVIIVYVNGENKSTGLKVKGKLNMIDLAGSERVKKSGVYGAAMKEAQNINKSLSALGDVIEALWKKCRHIPYRNSKLTFILQDSLGRSAKTLMFINVSPADIHCQETLTSLRFAKRAKNVELGSSMKNAI